VRSQDTRCTTGGDVHSTAPAAAPPPDTGLTGDERINRIVAATPAALQAEMRSFMQEINEQGDISRGTRHADAPDQAERIIGGEDVPPNAFQSCVCIGSETDWSCTGVLTAPRVVLTAAHCGHKLTRVMVGGNKVRPGLDPRGRIIPVQRVYVHSGYKPFPLNENDITLLVLEQCAGVPPVNIASAGQLRMATDVQLVGFGCNDPVRPRGFGIKRHARVRVAPIIRLDESTDFSALEEVLGFHSAYEFVAGRKGLGMDSCVGDSGGPAYLFVGEGPSTQYLLAGLTSRATRDAVRRCGDGGIYVRPDQFLPWIRSAMNASGLPPLPC
jgi:endonuclease G, mitochondrial